MSDTLITTAPQPGVVILASVSLPGTMLTPGRMADRTYSRGQRDRIPAYSLVTGALKISRQRVNLRPLLPGTMPLLSLDSSMSSPRFALTSQPLLFAFLPPSSVPSDAATDNVYEDLDA